MATSQLGAVAIAIFAKAPVAGFAKTRLIPRLGAAGAAALQRHLNERAVRIALAADIGPVSLWCSPDRQHSAFQEIGKAHDVALHDQATGDLGDRMSRAFNEMTALAPTLLMGTDCAVITAQHLRRSAALLGGNADAVFIPVEDGGYILVGLKRVAPSLFDRMPWGSASVMMETEVRARGAGLTIAKLEPLWDIDRPEDYDRARSSDALESPF